MRRISTILFLILTTALPLTAEELNFSRAGKANYTLLLPVAPLPTDLKAKEELQTYLKKITGLNFFAVNETADGKRPDGKVISIGKTAFAERNKPQGWTDDLGEVGYGIAVRDGNLFLFGGSRRGALNAAYAFLEDDLGCRWYSYRVERIPHKTELSADIKSRTSVPVFPSIRDSLNGCALYPDWALRNRTDQLYLKIPEELGGRHVSYTNPWDVHTYNLIVPPDRFKAHPEYFAMNADGSRNPGQRCPSDPGFRQLAVKFALEQLGRKPDCNYVMIGICDSPDFCHCPDCMAAAKRGGANSTAHMELVNTVAKAVAKEFPKAKVSTLAYWATGMPPKDFKLEPNVVIWLCTDCLAGELRQNPIYTSDVFRQRMQAWKSIAPEIHIWDYHCTFLNYFHYDTTLYAMTENLRYYAKNGVKGVQLQGDTTIGGEREELRAWVLAKLMWDPKLDPLQLIREYCYGVWGPTAGNIIYKFYRQIYFMGKQGKNTANPGALAEFETLRKTGWDAFNKAAAALKNKNDPELKALLAQEAMPVMLLQLEHLTGLLEQQAGNPAASAGQRTQFNRLYAEFAAAAQKGEIRFFAEGRTMDQLLDQLKLWDFQKHPRKLPLNGILISAAHGRISWNSGPFFSSDPESGSGASVLLSYTPAEYPIRWYDCDYPFLARDGKYRMAIRAKVDNAQPDKEVLTIGYFHQKTGFVTFHKVKGSELGKDYRWIDCGTFSRPGGFGYLYVYTLASDVAQNVRLDALELIPQK